MLWQWPRCNPGVGEGFDYLFDFILIISDVLKHCVACWRWSTLVLGLGKRFDAFFDFILIIAAFLSSLCVCALVRALFGGGLGWLPQAKFVVWLDLFHQLVQEITSLYRWI